MVWRAVTPRLLGAAGKGGGGCLAHLRGRRRGRRLRRSGRWHSNWHVRQRHAPERVRLATQHIEVRKIIVQGPVTQLVELCLQLVLTVSASQSHSHTVTQSHAVRQVATQVCVWRIAPASRHPSCRRPETGPSYPAQDAPRPPQHAKVALAALPNSICFAELACTMHEHRVARRHGWTREGERKDLDVIHVIHLFSQVLLQVVNLVNIPARRVRQEPTMTVTYFSFLTDVGASLARRRRFPRAQSMKGTL